MCGIAGVIYKDRKTHQVGEALTSMLESLQHRGPDSAGYAIYGGLNFPENFYQLNIEVNRRRGTLDNLKSYLNQISPIFEEELIESVGDSDVYKCKISLDSFSLLKPLISELDEFISEISTFLMKGIYASVAHIENVNEFYVYAQQRLHIKEDISSITVGLEALSSQQHNEHDRQEQEKDKRMSDSLAVISVLAIFSALSDGWAVAKDFMSEPLKSPRMILLIVILIITAVVSIFAVYVLIIMIKTRVCDIWNNVKRRKK